MKLNVDKTMNGVLSGIINDPDYTNVNFTKFYMYPSNENIGLKDAKRLYERIFMRVCHGSYIFFVSPEFIDSSEIVSADKIEFISLCQRRRLRRSLESSLSERQRRVRGKCYGQNFTNIFSPDLSTVLMGNWDKSFVGYCRNDFINLVNNNFNVRGINFSTI